MRGFCKEAVLVLPKPESISKRGESYIRELRKAVYNIRDFLAESDIKLQCFSSDELGMDLKLEGIEYIHILTPEDRNFLNVMKIGNAYCNGIDIDAERFGIYETVRRRIKVERGISQNERLTAIKKREKLAGKEYIKQCRMVFTFATKNNSYYPVSAVVGDKRLVFTIDNNLFIMTAKMSGTPIDIFYLYKDERLLPAVNEWELGGGEVAKL